MQGQHHRERKKTIRQYRLSVKCVCYDHWGVIPANTTSWINAALMSITPDQHQTSIGSKCHVCWDIMTYNTPRILDKTGFQYVSPLVILLVNLLTISAPEINPGKSPPPPAVRRRWLNVDLLLVYRLRRRPFCEPTFDQRLISAIYIQGTTSKSVFLKYGVPQGSVLGPVLFTQYTVPIGAICDMVCHINFTLMTLSFTSLSPSVMKLMRN